MRFIAGPRQTGKTFLAQNFLKTKQYSNLYYNWDNSKIREQYYKDTHFFQNEVFSTPKKGQHYWLCLDEFHKYRKWKNILKDYFDNFHSDIRFVVTGSAKLDLFRHSGDSLAGRYFLFHLLPLTLKEIISNKIFHLTKLPDLPKLINTVFDSPTYYQKEMEMLLQFSGFPEPLTMNSDIFHKRWQTTYLDSTVKNDLRDLTKINDLDNVIKLLLLLPTKVGSPLSINSLANDLEVTFKTLKNYITALNLNFLVFMLKPYKNKIARTLKKEQKLFFFDWSRIKDDGPRFENFIAVQLYAWLTAYNDAGLANFDLFYIKTKDGKETDFLILNDNIPWLLIEAKLKKSTLEYHHHKNSQILGNIPIIQLVKEKGIIEKKSELAFQISASRFLGNIF